MPNKLLSALGHVDSTITAWGVVSTVFKIFFIGGSGVATMTSAEGSKTAPLLSLLYEQLGDFASFVIFVSGCLIAVVLLALYRWAALKAAEQKQVEVFTKAHDATVNPLNSSFNNIVVKVEDLRLPHISVQRNKLFKDCQIVGPGIIAITGGCTFPESNTYLPGHFIPYKKGTILSGVTTFENCTFENCFFFRVQFIGHQNSSNILKKIGVEAVC